MINEHARKWLDHMRSPEARPKANGHLFDAKGCSCALGDAALLEWPEGSPEWSLGVHASRYRLQLDEGFFVNILPDRLWKKLGLRDGAGDPDNIQTFRPIYDLNDSTEMTKAEIADFIETHAEVYFT